MTYPDVFFKTNPIPLKSEYPQRYPTGEKRRISQGDKAALK